MRSTQIHPHLTHPLTGLPLAAVGFRADGRPIWPILGGADDAGGAAASAGDAGGEGGEGGGDTSNSGAGDGDKGGEGGGESKGFPTDTPVADMTPDQQAAYWKDKAQKHETAWRKRAGDLSPDRIQQLRDAEAERDTLRREKMTASEKAIEDAKAQAKVETRTEYAPKLARAVFEIALSHVEDADERNELIGALNLTSVITDDGEIDTDKVRSIVSKISPTDKGTGTRDYGAGRRGGGTSASGVSAGAEMFANSRKKSTTGS